MSARASRAGDSDGSRHAWIDNMDGDRSAFIKRPELLESEWPTYRDAYDAAYRAVMVLRRSA